MLLANATKGRSAIDGLGLFARETVHAGSIVWIATTGFDVFLTERDLSGLSPPARDFARTYAFFDPVKRLYVISTDDDRYTNDSETPNTRYDRDNCCTVAIKEIAAGEEITCDYFELEGRYPEWRALVPA